MQTLLHISNRQKAAVMVAVMLTMFLSALDQTIVSTALPTIVREFDALDHLSWVFTAYMLTSTIVVPIYGKLSDMYGRKGFFLLSIILFLAGSALCGVSKDMNQLIFFRALQGIGGGAIMTNCFAIIADLFSPTERGKWQGLMGAMFGLSSVFGPFLGGWITDHLSWRWNFYINMPLGAVAFLAVFLLMPRIKPSIQDRSIDYIGALYMAMGLASLLLALTLGGSQFDWNSVEIILLFAFSIVTLSFFGVVETLVKNPILPLNLFKNPVFSVAIALIFLIGMGMFGVISYIPLFAQKVVGVSATNSGTVMFPMMFGMVGASMISGQIISRTKRYKILGIFGTAFVLVSMIFLSQMDGDTTKGELVGRMILTGIGMGMTMPVFNLAVQNAFDHSKIGVVTAATQLFRSVGGTVGVAIAGTILNWSLEKNMGDLGIAVPNVFLVGLIFMGLAFLLSFFLKEIPFKQSKEHDSLQEAGRDLAVEEGNFAL